MHLFHTAAEYPLPAPEKLDVRETALWHVRCMVCRGSLLYAVTAENGGSLAVYDVSGGEPVLLSRYGGLGMVRQLRVEHGIALVTARHFGAYFFNVSDPKDIRLLCHYDTVELATAAVLSGKCAFIGCRTFGVEILDISVPDAPRHLSTLRAGEVQSAFVDGRYLYTGTWGERQVNIFDISDLESPKKLTVIPLSGRGDGLYVRDGLCYVAMGQHNGTRLTSVDEPGYGTGNGFAIYDVSDPARPEKLSEVRLPYRYYYWDWDNWDIVRSGDYAILSHTLNGLLIYDVRDPRRPVLVSHTLMPSAKPFETFVKLRSDWRPICLPFDPERESFAPLTCAAVSDGRIFLGLGKENMRVAYSEKFFRETPPIREAPLTADFYDRDPGENAGGVLIRRTAAQARETAVLNGKIYAACGDYGVGVYDPEELVMLSHPALPGSALSVRACGGRLYVACGTEGAAICEPEGSGLRVIGRWKREQTAVVQVVPSANGRHLLLHANDNRLLFLDLSDPENPVPELEEKHGPGLVYYRQVTQEGAAGRFFGGYWNGNGIHWYDLGGETVTCTGETPGKYTFAMGVTGTPDGGFLLADKSGLKLFASPDAEPEQIYASEKTFRGKPQLFGDRLLVTDRLMGDVLLFDASDLHRPKLLRRWNFSGHPDLGCRLGDAAYVPLGHQGLAKLSIK